MCRRAKAEESSGRQRNATVAAAAVDDGSVLIGVVRRIVVRLSSDFSFFFDNIWHSIWEQMRSKKKKKTERIVVIYSRDTSRGFNDLFWGGGGGYGWVAGGGPGQEDIIL